MVNPHTKFEVFTIACDKEMKGNAKCINSRFFERIGFTCGLIENALLTSY